MDPTNNILQMLESNSTTYQSTSYYLTCSGYNPLQYYISQANFYLDILNQSVTDLLQSYCKDNSYLKQVLVNISKSKSLLVSMQGLLNCSTIRGYYDAIIETAYCNDIFQGNYMFWLAFYVAGAALCFVPWFFWGFRLGQSADMKTQSPVGTDALIVTQEPFAPIAMVLPDFSAVEPSSPPHTKV